MDKPPFPEDEQLRLSALQNLEILDTEKEPAYDKLVRLAAYIANCEIALISLIDANRQWFKAAHGLAAEETGREISFCGHAILSQDIFIVENALEDSRFADNPLVIGEPHIRFYAGVPLLDRGGYALGTLCVISAMPKQLSADQVQLLRDIADQVCQLFQLRRTNQELVRNQQSLESYQQESDDERELVSQLMTRMMRPDHLDSSAMQCSIKPAENIGGDLMSAIYSPHGKYYVMLADAAGHGMPAAVSLLPVSQIFYAMVNKNMTVTSMVQEMNRVVFDQLPIERFVAAAILCFDKYNSTVEIWNGGMPEVKFLADEGQILRRFGSMSLPLGIRQSDEPPRTELYQWQERGQLFVCSDGLLEAVSPEGEFFESQVEQLLVDSQPGQRFDLLKHEVQAFAGDRSPVDDISMCIIDTDWISS